MPPNYTQQGLCPHFLPDKGKNSFLIDDMQIQHKKNRPGKSGFHSRKSESAFTQTHADRKIPDIRNKGDTHHRNPGRPVEFMQMTGHHRRQ